MIAKIFILLLAFQLKHFLADYPLQTRSMLGKFRDDWGFVWPLTGHCSIHMIGTLIIAAAIGADHILGPRLALFDFSVHFIMDRVKASKRYLGRYKTLTADTAPNATEEQWKSNDRFWWSMGFDQMVHHLTHYVIIWYLVRG